MNSQEARKIVYDTCIAQGLSPYQAALVVAQGIHESADFTSNVFRKNNNGFGMKIPAVRKSPFILGRGTAAPTNEAPGNRNNVYARYASLADSTKDLIHRQKHFKIEWAKMTSPEIYIAFNKRTLYFQGSETDYKKNVAAFVKSMGIKLEETVTAIKKKAPDTNPKSS